MNKLKALALAATLASGCFAYGVHSPARPQVVSQTQLGVTFLWGLVGTDVFTSQCPTGLSYVRTYQPWWGFVVTAVTIGIVTPWQGEWSCS
jgi:hypothetical protein